MAVSIRTNDDIELVGGSAWGTRDVPRAGEVIRITNNDAPSGAWMVARVEWDCRSFTFKLPGEAEKTHRSLTAIVYVEPL